MKLQEVLNVFDSSEEVCVTLRVQKTKKELDQTDLLVDLKELEVVSIRTYGCSMQLVEVRKDEPEDDHSEFYGRYPAGGSK